MRIKARKFWMCGFVIAVLAIAAVWLSSSVLTISDEQIKKSGWKNCRGVPSIGDGFNGADLHLVQNVIYIKDKPYAVIIRRDSIMLLNSIRLTIQNLENKGIGEYCNK